MARSTRSLRVQFDGIEFASARAGLMHLAKQLDDFHEERMSIVVARELERYLHKVATIVATRNAGYYPGGTSASSLSQRSGDAKESIHNSVNVSLTGGRKGGQSASVRAAGGRITVQRKRVRLVDVVGVIGGIWYLKIHEYGGTIRPKNAEWLTIPLPAALDSRGVPKKRSARQWRNTFIRESRAGNLIIFQSASGRAGRTERANGRSGITPLYVLKKEVYIPPRLGMGLTLDQFVGKFLATTMDAVMADFYRSTR